jgi:NitT/TauT family transport system permease protein
MTRLRSDNRVLQIIGLLTPLVLWGVLSYVVDNSVFLPKIQEVVLAFIELMQNGFLVDIGASILRVITGLVVAAVVAFPLGILLGTKAHARDLGMKSLSFIRYIPPSAFIPLLILWTGIGEFQKILFIFLAVAPYITLLVVDAVLRVPKQYIEHAKIHGANSWQVTKTVIIPSILPDFIDILRAMHGAAWTFIILAEIIGASKGIGHVMVQAQRFLQTDTIFVAIIVTGVMGVIADKGFVLFKNRVIRWRHA